MLSEGQAPQSYQQVEEIGDTCILVKDLDSGDHKRIDPTSLQQIQNPTIMKKNSLWESYWSQLQNLQTDLLRLVTHNKIQQLTDALKSHPIDINLYSYMDGWTLLHHAVNKGFYNIVALLLVEGIDKNKETKTMKNTALHLAVLKNQEEIVELLITQGADPNAVDADSCTPFHHATQFGYWAIAKKILQYSEIHLDFSLKNNKGMTPIDCCIDERIIYAINQYQQKHSTLKVIRNEDQYNKRIIQMKDGKVLRVRSRADRVENLMNLVSSKSEARLPSIQKHNYSLVGSKMGKTRYQYMEKLAKKSVSSYRDLLNNYYIETLKDYDRIRKIGEGSFGEIYLARKKNSSKLYAIKSLSKKKIKKQKLQKYVYSERQVLKQINHPFIIHGQSFFQDSSYLYIVMEFCEGSDLEKVIRKNPLDENLTKKYVCQVILAIQELHRNKILFRDLKSSNILIDSFGHVKVSDFGLSKQSELSDSFLGSYAYLAPEMLAQESERVHNLTIDWYLLGVFLYELLTGLPPFYNENRMTMFKLIKEADPKFPEDISGDCRDLLKKLLIKDPRKRLGKGGSEQIKNHPWFSDMNWKNVLEKKLDLPQPNLNQKQIRKKGFIQDEYIDPYDKHIFQNWDYTEKNIQK